MRAASLAAAAAVLVLAGCGGGGSAPPPRHQLHLTAFERRGKELFITDCGGCHQLEDAGTGGTVGPALASPLTAASVRTTIANGGAVMQAGLLAGTKAAAVAAYVAAATK